MLYWRAEPDILGHGSEEGKSWRGAEVHDATQDPKRWRIIAQAAVPRLDPRYLIWCVCHTTLAAHLIQWELDLNWRG